MIINETNTTTSQRLRTRVLLSYPPSIVLPLLLDWKNIDVAISDPNDFLIKTEADLAALKRVSDIRQFIYRPWSKQELFGRALYLIQKTMNRRSTTLRILPGLQMVEETIDDTLVNELISPDSNRNLSYIIWNAKNQENREKGRPFCIKVGEIKRKNVNHKHVAFCRYVIRVLLTQGIEIAAANEDEGDIFIWLK